MKHLILRPLPLVAAIGLVTTLGACTDDSGLFAPSTPIEMPDFAKGGNGGGGSGGGGNGGNGGGGTIAAPRILFAVFMSNWQIYSIKADGTDQQVVPNSDYGAHPAWSPDRTKIAFSMGVGSPVPGLYVMNADGTGRTLLRAADIAMQPSWSPDGSQIAFAARGINDEVAIFVISAQGGYVRQVTPADGWADWSPTWSPDGQRLAYERYAGTQGEIWVVNADGTSPMPVTSCAALQFSCTSPEWSPVAGSMRIAFSLRSSAGKALGLINADGTDMRNVVYRTDHATHDLRPSWSPDGTRIVFSSAMGTSELDFYTVKPNGTGLRQLTATAGFPESMAAWAR